MKLNNIPTYINDITITYINGLLTMTDDEIFDEEVFQDWLLQKDIEHKNNPSAYLRSCFKKELDNGSYKPKVKLNYVPNTQVLINELRNRGICVLADDTVWLNVVWKHLINWQGINIKDCVELNHKILDYMGDSKSFEDYKKLLIGSKTLKKYEINWNLLDEKVKMEILGWEDYLKSLELESEQ